MCLHRDTIAYPATPHTTGTIASIPSAVLSIFRSVPSCAHERGAWPSLGRRSNETQLVDDYYGRRAGVGDTIARRTIFKARWGNGYVATI